MKAVVVEVKDKFVVVLSDDGCISKIRNKNYIIGQEIKLGNNLKYIRFAATAAACLMLFATPVWAYLTPYSYVSLDSNQSFEFLVNRFDRVLQVEVINDDISNVEYKIDVSKLKNKEIGEAVKDVITELKGQEYLSNAKEEGIVVAASSKNQVKTDKLTTTLKVAVEKTEDAVGSDENKENKIKEQSKEENKQAKEESKEKSKEEKEKSKSEEDNKSKSEKTEREDKDFNVEIIEVSKEMVDKAKDNGVTPGKMKLIEKLQLSAESVGKSIDSDQWLDKSVKDIMEKTKEYEIIARREEKNTKKDDKSDKKDGTNEKRDDKSDDKNGTNEKKDEKPDKKDGTNEKKDDKSDKKDNKTNKDSDKK